LLLSFFVRSDLLLVSAKLVELDTVSGVLWILRSSIVAVLAASTFKGEEWAIALRHCLILLLVL
jgi:hypothetical protein